MGFPTFHRTTVPLHQRAQIEDRHGRLIAPIDPPSWRVVPREKSSGVRALILAAVIGLIAGYLARPHFDTALEHPARTSSQPAPQQTPAPAPRRCSYPDGRINDWPNGPIDYFHFLPRCDEGGRR